jgi:hypothetical protein
VTDLTENFKKAIQITMSNPPLPEVQEHEYKPASQWQHQLDSIVSSPASFERLWQSVKLEPDPVKSKFELLPM